MSKKILIYFILMISVIGFYVPLHNAEPLVDGTDIFMVEWEDWYVDEISGENDYLEWGTVAGSTYHNCTVEVKSYSWSGYNVLDFGNAGRDVGQGGDARFNFSDFVIEQGMYNTWCIGLYVNSYHPYGSSSSTFTIDMYNETGVKVHGFRLVATYCCEFDAQVWANDGYHNMGEHLVVPTYGTITGLVWLNTTFVGGTTFNSSWYWYGIAGETSKRTVGTYSGAWDYTPNVWNSSTDYQITYMIMTLATSNPSWAPQLSVDFDDFIYSEDIESDWGFIYDEEGGGGGECYDVLDTYIPTGIDDTSIYYTAKQQFMHIYNVYTTGNLNAVSLTISKSMYNLYHNLSDYKCSILGDDFISADCFQELVFGYRVIWFCDYGLGEPIPNQQSGMYLYSQFYRPTGTALYSNKWWEVGAGDFGQDLDNDGDTTFKEDDDVTIEYDGGMIVPQEVVNIDVGVVYWLESPYIEPPDVEYNDTIFMTGYDGVNETGYLYYMDNPNGMVIGYTTGNGTGYLYRIHLEKNDSSSINDEWYNIVKPTGEVYFPSGHSMWYPENSKTVGKYNFTLKMDEGASMVVKDYVVAYFINRTEGQPYENYYIETRPSTTEAYENYEIFYNYNNPLGNDGYIGVFRNLDDRNDWDEAYYQSSVLGDNTTGTIFFTSSTSITNEYLTLFIKEGSAYYPVAYCTHYIKSPSALWNEIYVDKASLEINAGNPEQRHIHILGTHVYPQGEVWIYLNNKQWASVQYEQHFDEIFYPSVAGLYKAELVIMENAEKIVLDYCTFTITVSGGGGGGGGGTEPILPTVTQPLGSIIGLIITIFTLLTPFIVGASIHLKTSIHPVIYAMTGGLGLSISTILGFFPVWIPLFVVVCGIIVIVIFYIRGTTLGSSGGE